MFYRQDLLVWRRKQLGISIQETARQSGELFESVRRAFLGKATNKKVYPVAKFLCVDWSLLHKLDLKESEFHLAVTNGNGSHLAG